MQIVETFGGRRRDRAGLAEVFDDMPLSTKNRDHARIGHTQILSQSSACVLPAPYLFPAHLLECQAMELAPAQRRADRSAAVWLLDGRGARHGQHDRVGRLPASGVACTIRRAQPRRVARLDGRLAVCWRWCSRDWRPSTRLPAGLTPTPATPLATSRVSSSPGATGFPCGAPTPRSPSPWWAISVRSCLSLVRNNAYSAGLAIAAVWLLTGDQHARRPHGWMSSN